MGLVDGLKSRRAESMMRQFGKRLRAARIVAGYETADDVADALKIEPPRYRKYERGEALPPIDVLEDLCRLLDQDLSFLLRGPDPA